MSLVLLGHYDLWVKRGVVSVMGAKLHPSPRLYRVYAPSTHSLPVIKCVSGVDGAAEIEVKSCHSGIYRLRDLSPLYRRIWNGKNTSADKLTLKNAPSSAKRTFSVVSEPRCSDIKSLNLTFCSCTRPQTIPSDGTSGHYILRSNGAQLSNRYLSEEVH